MQKPGCGTPLISADLNGIHLLPPSDEVKTATSQQTQVRALTAASLHAKRIRRESDLLLRISELGDQPRSENAAGENEA